MFSVKGDTVLDPLLGTGTTMAAAMAAGRCSIGMERETDFLPIIRHRLDSIIPFSNERIHGRLTAHEVFIRERYGKKGGFKHRNRRYGFPVVTNQETSLLLNNPATVTTASNDSFEISYDTSPQDAFCKDWQDYFMQDSPKKPVGKTRQKKKQDKLLQRSIL